MIETTRKYHVMYRNKGSKEEWKKAFGISGGYAVTDTFDEAAKLAGPYRGEFDVMIETIETTVTRIDQCHL